MNYTLNPFAPALFCAALCTAAYKRTFLSESLNFSWREKEEKSVLWKLKLNTFLPTTPGCLKECCSFLSQSRDRCVSIPLLAPKNPPPARLARHPAASVPEKPALWFHLRVLLYHTFDRLVMLPLFHVSLKEGHLHVWSVMQIITEANWPAQWQN